MGKSQFIALNKKGSYSVFALILFCSVLIVAFASILVTRNVGVTRSIASLGQIWAKNIVSEYDIFLNEKYGLLGYYGNEALVDSKLEKYADYSLNGKDYVNFQKISSKLDDYRLNDVSNFKKQILKIVSRKVISEKGKIRKKVSLNRRISADWITDSLPSKGKKENLSLTGLVASIKNGLTPKALLNESAINRYIFLYFKDYMKERSEEETFFNCEIEYIISGKLSDSSAKQDVVNKIKTVRNLLNLAYLYASKEKSEAALALAEIITPGPMSLVTQAVILEGWALAEAENDVALILNNRTVPLLKGDENWALSLENIFSAKKTEGEEEGEEKYELEEKGTDFSTHYIEPKRVTGRDYEEYLRLLLNFMSDDIKLYRIMDLIQINMKFLYVGYFNMADYYTGVTYDIWVNGIKNEFEQSYD